MVDTEPIPKKQISPKNAEWIQFFIDSDLYLYNKFHMRVIDDFIERYKEFGLRMVISKKQRSLLMKIYRENKDKA